MSKTKTTKQKLYAVRGGIVGALYTLESINGKLAKIRDVNCSRIVLDCNVERLVRVNK